MYFWLYMVLLIIVVILQQLIKKKVSKTIVAKEIKDNFVAIIPNSEWIEK